MHALHIVMSRCSEIRNIKNVDLYLVGQVFKSTLGSNNINWPIFRRAKYLRKIARNNSSEHDIGIGHSKRTTYNRSRLSDIHHERLVLSALRFHTAATYHISNMFRILGLASRKTHIGHAQWIEASITKKASTRLCFTRIKTPPTFNFDFKPLHCIGIVYQ